MKRTGRPPSSTNLRRKPIVLPPNIMKKAKTKRETGIRNERWSTQIALTSWQRKPTASQGR